MTLQVDQAGGWATRSSQKLSNGGKVIDDRTCAGERMSHWSDKRHFAGQVKTERPDLLVVTTLHREIKWTNCWCDTHSN